MIDIKKLTRTLLGAFLVYSLFIGQSFGDDNQLFSTSEVESLVTKAKEHVLKVGKDQALKDFMDSNNKEFHPGGLYVFAFDFNGICLSHLKKDMVGTNLMELKDPQGAFIIKDLLAAAKNGKGWTEYLWKNYTLNKVEKKYSYTMKVDDTIVVGIGINESQRKQ
jgi:signal transduction histidine kinase